LRSYEFLNVEAAEMNKTCSESFVSVSLYCSNKIP
jgi:hypothetical protein